MGGVCLDPCQNDASCQQNDPRSACNLRTGLCEVDPDACRGPIDDVRCGIGRICGDGGRCLDGCRIDQDCRGGEVCLDNNQCGLQPECQNDAECRAGFRCEAGVCSNICGGPADCPAGFLCNDNQTCELDLACADDTDCIDINGTICVAGTCSDRCVDNAVCPGAQVCLVATGRCIDGCVDDFACPGQICNPATAQCEDKPACQNDDDGVCAQGEICVDDRCVAGCTVNLGLCRADQQCDAATNRCIDRVCQSADDCGAGELCSGGRCAPGCGLVGGPICQGNRICDEATGLCPELSNDCRRAEDCDAGRVCDCLAGVDGCFIGGGTCIDACGPRNPCDRGVCDPNGSGFCVNAPGVCQDDADCVEGRICEAGGCVESCLTRACPGTRVCDVQSGRCPQPEQCFSNDDCDAPSRCDIATNACVASCNGAAPCEGGLTCDDELLICRGCLDVSDCPNDRWTCNGNTGVCDAPEACVENVDCPDAQVCDVVTGECVEGCANDGECAGNQVCGVASICQENPDGCQAPADCVRNRVCALGVCEEPCANDDVCPGRQTCSPNTGLCREAAGGACGDDIDCLGNRVCLGGTCRDRQCLVNSDCAGSCVDFVCVDRPPQGCLANADCGPGQTCSEAGACIRTEPGCTEDVQCPEATPYCRSGACVVCEIDDECGTGYACVNDRCAYFPPVNCAADNECPGSQRCEDDDEGNFVCSPGPCPQNELSGQTVVSRTYTGLVLCDGATDVYLYEVPANEGLEVTVRHEPGRGDLALEIREEQTVLGRADGVYGTEVLSLLPQANARTLEIAVSGRSGSATSYDLSVRALAENECGPDAYEGPLGNDSQADATTIGLGSHALNLCAGERDWVRIPAVVGSDLTVSYTGLNDTLTATLLDPNNMPVANDGNRNQITTTVAQRGDYWVQIANDGALSLPVDVTVASVANADGPNVACQSPIQLQANVPVNLPEQLYTPRFNLACAPDDAGAIQEHLLRFEVPFQASVRIELDGIVFGAVGVQSQCNAAAANDPCQFVSEVDGFTLDSIMDAGTYFLVVKSIPLQNTYGAIGVRGYSVVEKPVLSTASCQRLSRNFTLLLH